MTNPDNHKLQARCNELEKSLKDARKELLYYKNIASLTGQKRVSEVEHFSEIIQSHKEAQKALKNIRDELETRIHERTRDLITSNEQLKKEIGEREKTEKILKESEEKYRLITENATDVIWVMDLESQSFRYVSPSIKRILGYTEKEFENRTLAQTVTPKSLEFIQKTTPIRVERMLRGDTSYYRDKIDVIHKDGHVVSTEINMRFVKNHSNGLIEANGVMRDITDQKNAALEKEKLQKQLLHAQKMESIGNLAGGIAHEFNNILGIIIGNNELVMEELSEWSLGRESAEEIKIAGMRARDVVKQLLTFSRQDAFEKKIINLQFEVNESIKLLRSSTPVSVEFKKNIPHTSFSILGNATQINQLLINLTNNAVDAMPSTGGLITYELSNEEVDGKNPYALTPGKYVKLIVRDNGIGMDKETLGRIFDPYYTTKEVGKGTGIGLAVVHGIVEQHNGSIVALSKLGHGTTFIIHLPINEGLSESESDGQNDLPTGSESLLYVDDEPSIAKLGKLHLENLGYSVESTTDPEFALEMIKEDPARFDLVISDMTMPKMTGDRLLSEVLKIRPDMPTIICTGYSAKISQKEALEIGAASFVMKPLNKVELAQVVRRVLDEHQYSN